MLAAAILLSLAAAWQAPAAGSAADRCVAGNLALPVPGPWSGPAAGLWTTSRVDELPADESGCYALRVAAPDTVSGVVLFVAAPRSTPDGDRNAQIQAVAAHVVRVASMNIRVDEPKWRKMDVPFSGLPGFGHGTMFGFDGTAIEGDDRSDVILLVFEGPGYVYVASLVGPAEADDAADWKAALAGYRAMLAGLNKVARPAREPGR